MIDALEFLPPNGEPPQLLFLLFHGVGQNARQMVPLASRLAREYPQAAIFSLQGPQAYDGPGDPGSSRQWFSTRDVNESVRVERVAAVLPDFVTAIRTLASRFDLPWERTALAGFSQGAIMALEAVQAEPRLAGRVLSFCGRHAALPDHAPADTSVHFFHGMADSVFPPNLVVDSARQLMALGGDVTADVLPGLAHSLDDALLDKAIEQLRTFIPKRVWREAMGDAPVVPRMASSKELGAGPAIAPAADDPAGD